MTSSLSTPPLDEAPYTASLHTPSSKDGDVSVVGLEPLNLGYLDIAAFPERTPFGQIPPTTFHNIKYLLEQRGVKTRFNVIAKKTELRIPGLVSSIENADSSAMTHVLSMVAAAGLSTSRVPELVLAISDQQLFNPAATWIKSRPWDRKDRLPEFYSTLTVREGFPNELKEAVMYRWMLSAAAAAILPSGFRTRGVLTLQGPQGLGKTTWVKSLINEPRLRSSLILGEHLLDPSQKDSVLTALRHWVVEIGELDSSFRKDMGRLKAFMTNNFDKIRPPYGSVDNPYPRRTVFCATVNEDQFLLDPTGNTRWMTLPVVAIQKDHDVDMQQVFAQLAEHVEQGTQWWLSDEHEKWLESFNKQHMVTSAISEKLMNIIDTDRIPTLQDRYMGTVELLTLAGVHSPRNPETKEAARVLRELYGEPKKVNSGMKWRVSLRSEPHPHQTVADEDRF